MSHDPDHPDGFTSLDHEELRKKIHEHCSSIKVEQTSAFPLVSESQRSFQFSGGETRLSTEMSSSCRSMISTRGSYGSQIHENSQNHSEDGDPSEISGM